MREGVVRDCECEGDELTFVDNLSYFLGRPVAQVEECDGQVHAHETAPISREREKSQRRSQVRD